MAVEHPDDVVRLTIAPNSVDAHIWQNALEEDGIRCRVVGDYLEAGIGDIPGFSPEIWVHRDDLTRAQEILRRHQQAPDANSGKAQ